MPSPSQRPGKGHVFKMHRTGLVLKQEHEVGTASSPGARVGSVSQLSPWVPPTLLGIQFCVLGPQPHSQARSHALVVVLASPWC